MKIYEHNEHPCVVDADITKRLTTKQNDLLDAMGCFVFYRKDSEADECGVDIVLADFEGEQKFSTIIELKMTLQMMADYFEATE